MGAISERFFRTVFAGIAFIAMSLSIAVAYSNPLPVMDPDSGAEKALISVHPDQSDKLAGGQSCPNMANCYHRLSGHCGISVVSMSAEGTSVRPAVSLARKIRPIVFATGAPPARLFRPPIA